MYQTILAPVDGSDSSERAVDHAIDLADRFDASLHAIYVVDTTRYGSGRVGDSETVLGDLTSQGETVLERVADRAPVDVRTVLRRGEPSEEIQAYAEELDADLLVLGHRGIGDPGDGHIGSIAERVVRTVDRPVITA